jgi:hypothetical protein
MYGSDRPPTPWAVWVFAAFFGGWALYDGIAAIVTRHFQYRSGVLDGDEAVAFGWRNISIAAIIFIGAYYFARYLTRDD